MTKSLFREGGPHKVKRLDNDQYSMSINMPKDEDGRTARECPNSDCSPGYFKVMPGTGITSGQESAFCPYCRHEAKPNDFMTREQIRYVKDLAIREAYAGIDGMVKDALGLSASGKRKISGGPISIELSYKPGNPPHVHRPLEDEVRRDVICPYCTLNQTVFGLATWCSDCGADIFLTHVSTEIAVTRAMLQDVNRRQKELGKRVAAKDLENCLEDAVSIFEASVKAIARRALGERGKDQSSIEAQMKKMGNSFQSIDRTRTQLTNLFNFSPASGDIWKRLEISFGKRHPVTHNLGVVDRKYIERAQQSEREGREVRVSESEVASLLDDTLSVISDIHKALVGASK